MAKVKNFEAVKSFLGCRSDHATSDPDALFLPYAVDGNRVLPTLVSIKI